MLEKLSRKGKVDEVLLAMPSASKATLKALLQDIENFSLKVRILPGLADLAQGKILVSELKEVRYFRFTWEDMKLRQTKT